MPLTDFQSAIAKLVSTNRSPESHLAGGAALHITPNSKRFSNDLDYFHDSEERVGEAFNKDRSTLEHSGYTIAVEMNQPGYIRALVSKASQSTKIEWAYDSSWRFMPAIKSELAGYQLHPIDIAINKLLTLAGRDEPRDFLDILHIHQEILPLGALCWAACGKDPGFSPRSLLELVKRRGKYRPEDFKRLNLAQPIDLQQLKDLWLSALASAETFISNQPPDQAGCLYYSTSQNKFVAPDQNHSSDILPHFPKPGGVLPAVKTD